MDLLVEVICPNCGLLQLEIRQAPDGVVEEIERLHAELQGVSFLDAEVLVGGEVQGESGRSGYAIAGGVAERIKWRQGERRDIEL